jgi:putative redox protein
MVSLSLDWTGDLNFQSSAGFPAIELHSSTEGIASPPQALAYAVMACMAMDVVYVLRKQRLTFTALNVRFEGERAPEPPRRYLWMKLHFTITGEVPDPVAERAIQLSRDKYCSVWHTIRPDVNLDTSFEVHNVST